MINFKHNNFSDNSASINEIYKIDLVQNSEQI